MLERAPLTDLLARWVLRAAAFLLPLAFLPNIVDEFVLPKLLLARLLVAVSVVHYKRERVQELAVKQEATPNDPAGHEPVLTASGRLLAPNGPGLLTEEAFKQAAAQNLPVIQLAIFDLGGDARRAEKNEVTTLEETWKGIPVQNFSSVSELEAWEKNWPNDGGRPAAKIVYDPASGRVRVSGRSQGRVFQKTFPVETDLATTLQQVELAQRLGESLSELKPPMGDILSDFFLHGLRYEEIAKRRGVAVGSVGVYLKRGLDAMRRIWGREENS